jgi:integrase
MRKKKMKRPAVFARPSKASVMSLPEYAFAVQARGKTYYYYQRRRGFPDAGPRIRLPEPNSPEWFAALAAATNAEPIPSGISLSTVWEAYRAGKRGPKAPGTIATYASAWRIMRPLWGDLHPKAITSKAIAELHDALSDRESMANMVLTVAHNILEEALRLGLVETNAATGIRRHEIVKVDGAKPLTREAWAAFMSPACPAPVYRLAILGRGTGQRISDLITMTPAMRERDGIRHGIQKRRRHIDSHWSQVAPDYLRTIDGWQGFPSAPYVNCEGRVSTDSLRRQWNAFAETMQGSALVGFTPHDLRATNFCDHILAGDSPADVARIRNVSEAMVIRYTRHLKPEDFAEARKSRA